MKWRCQENESLEVIVNKTGEIQFLTGEYSNDDGAGLFSATLLPGGTLKQQASNSPNQYLLGHVKSTENMHISITQPDTVSITYQDKSNASSIDNQTINNITQQSIQSFHDWFGVSLTSMEE